MDAVLVPRRILSIFSLFCVVALNVACSGDQGYVSYSHQGFSLKYPETWRFEHDQNASLEGEREVVFALGDVSYVSFYYNPHMTFEEFSRQYIEDFYLNDASSASKLTKQENILLGGREGIDYEISAEFLGQLNTRVIAVDVSQHEQSVYMVAGIAEEDQLDLVPVLNRVVKSISVQNINDGLGKATAGGWLLIAINTKDIFWAATKIAT